MVNWNDRFSCEMPNYDGCRVFMSIREMLDFIGDEKIVYNDERGLFQVPAWAAGIQKYSEMKQAQCDVWGCN